MSSLPGSHIFGIDFELARDTEIRHRSYAKRPYHTRFSGFWSILATRSGAPIVISKIVARHPDAVVFNSHFLRQQ